MQTTFLGRCMHGTGFACLWACAGMFPVFPASAQAGGAGLHAGDSTGFAGSGICIPATVKLPEELRIFRNLNAGSIASEADSADAATDYDELPISIEANEVEARKGAGYAFHGDVRIIQGGRGIFANRVILDEDTRIAESSENVRIYTSNGDEVFSNTMKMALDTYTGVMEDVRIRYAHPTASSSHQGHNDLEESRSFLAPQNRTAVQGNQAVGREYTTVPIVRASATARKVSFEGEGFQRLEYATLSTCNENRDVVLTARRLELDHASGTGSARDMVVRFKDMPIFYFPAVTFPINDERKSGFLFPRMGYDDQSGAIFGIPYYANISPQQDATVMPRLFSRRGLQVHGEYRYLTRRSSGTIRAEYLPDDDVFKGDRHAFSLDHRHRFTKTLMAEVDLNDVSDTRYLRDFSNDVGVRHSSYIPQDASVTYRDSVLYLRTRFSAFERVNQDVSIASQPYERMPEIKVRLREQELSIFRFGIRSDLTHFNHDDDKKVDGTRIGIEPYVSLPLEKAYGHFVPRLSVHGIRYDLNNNPNGDKAPSVSVPVFSIDSGLVLERLFSRSDTTYLQTLEPRLFYVRIPVRSKQELFPDFDTRRGELSSLSRSFRENRFLGGDRVGDTHQLSLGIRTRFVDNGNGREKLNLGIGRIFFFDDRKVGLTTAEPDDTRDKSGLLAEISGTLADRWTFQGFSKWAEPDNEENYLSLSARYAHDSRHRGSVRYSKRQRSSEQVNLRVETSLGPRWQLQSEFYYSLLESKLRTVKLGFGYDGCCWAARLQLQRYALDTDYDDRIVFSFALDDLGKISTGP